MNESQKSYLNTQHEPFFWTIGGGKGGVGKTLVGSSLAICLARLGYNVTIVDLDLGSANLHTCLGKALPPLSLSDYFMGRVKHLEQLCYPTEIYKLNFISGWNDSLTMADLPQEKLDLLSNDLKKLPADFIVLDLGAGTHEKTIELFLQGDRQVLTFTPEPTSIENAYRFLKVAFYMKLKKIEDTLNLKDIMITAMDQKNSLNIRSPADLVQFLIKERPLASDAIKKQLSEFHVDLIINQTRSLNDIELGSSVLSVCKKYFGVSIRLLGHLDFDNAVWQAVRKKRPVLLEFPNSIIAGQFLQISKNLLDYKTMKAVI